MWNNVKPGKHQRVNHTKHVYKIIKSMANLACEAFEACKAWKACEAWQDCEAWFACKV